MAAKLMIKENQTYVNSYTGDDSVAMFLAFAIEQYKNHKGISGEESASILDKAGILEHFEEYYDVLHTQSARWLLSEIDEMIANQNTPE